MFPYSGFHFGWGGVPCVSPNSVGIVSTFNERSWRIGVVGHKANVSTAVRAHGPVTGPILGIILQALDPDAG